MRAENYCLLMIWMFLRKVRTSNRDLHPYWHVNVVCESPMIVFALEIQGLPVNEPVMFGGILHGEEII